MAKRLLKLTSPLMRGDDVREYQRLVAARGFSPGNIDGIYGKNSVAACKAFQKAKGLSVDGMCGAKTWAALEAQSGGTKPHTEHFQMSEWRCNDGRDVPEKYWGNLQRLMTKLEELRAYVGNKPIRIVSGYRSPEYNAMLRKKDPKGVAQNSQHMYATAADIRISGMTPAQVQAAANVVFNDGGMGKYATFTHVDVRGYRARW